MTTRSKSSGWSPAADAAVFAGCCLLVLSGCGDKDPPPGSHWTASYEAFGGNEPAEHTDPNWKEYLDRPVIGEIRISAPGVMTAFAELNRQVREAGAAVDLKIAQVEPDHPSYRKPINLEMNYPTVAEVIDAIARQAGELVWDFQDEQLVIRPKD